MNNQFVANEARYTGLTGMFIDYAQSIISNNFIWGCNQSETSSGQHQMIVNYSSNVISNNYINLAGVTQGFALDAPGTNVVSNNSAYGGVIYLGSANAVTSQTIGNTDSVYGITGSFTPTVVVGSTAQTVYSVQEGFYTRVGKRVFFDITIQLNAAISGTGSVSVSLGNLPDATAVGTGVYGAVGSVQAINSSYTGVLGWFIADNSSSIALVLDTNGTQSQITNSNLTSSSKFYISGSYLAAL
jgi:hypothetical protein